MTASFRIYIDEAGDEGFKFRKRPDVQSSSDWFFLGAFVVRKESDLETVRIVDRAREEFERPPRKHIHWKDLKHPQKVRYCQLIAEQKARILAVCVHKPSLLEPENFRERYRLYFYTVRYLMERASWLIRDHHNPQKHSGDGTAEIVFSNRQGMSYEELKQYLKRLSTQKENGMDIRVDFGKIPIEQITALTPGRCMGLQLADAAAGAVFNAFETDRFGNTEPRYIHELLPLIYRYEKKIIGYGLKIAPKEAIVYIDKKDCLKWLYDMGIKKADFGS